MDNSHILIETQEFLHQQIPITRAMGIQVESFDNNNLTLSAPIALNYNHLGTAFGGSLSAIATLAGYALLWLELGDRFAHIVVRESTIRYDRPVTGDIRAVCKRISSDALMDFKTKFHRNGKARITLPVTIESDGLSAVAFMGVFVAIASETEQGFNLA